MDEDESGIRDMTNKSTRYVYLSCVSLNYECNNSKDTQKVTEDTVTENMNVFQTSLSPINQTHGHVIDSRQRGGQDADRGHRRLSSVDDRKGRRATDSRQRDFCQVNSAKKRNLRSMGINLQVSFTNRVRRTNRMKPEKERRSNGRKAPVKRSCNPAWCMQEERDGEAKNPGPEGGEASENATDEKSLQEVVLRHFYVTHLDKN